MKTTLKNRLAALVLPGCAALALVALAAPLSAAGYLKFDGVDGEAVDKDHKDWINLLSVSQPVSRAQGSAPATGRPKPGVSGPGSLTVTLKADKASPRLTQAIANGKAIPKLVIDVPLAGEPSREGKRATYYRYELTNVIVSSYSHGAGSSAGHVPTEQLSLNYEKIKVSYAKAGAKKGNAETTWKVEKGEAKAAERRLTAPPTKRIPTRERKPAPSE